MIINDSLKLNEVKSIDLGNGKIAYQLDDKYYIKSGDSKKEISADQYNKLKDKDDTWNKQSKSDKDEGKWDFLDKVKDKEDALRIIKVLKPAKDNTNTDMWTNHFEMILELIKRFNLSKDEVLDSLKG